MNRLIDEKMESLQRCVTEFCHRDFLLHSRIVPLHSYFPRSVSIKRDDEMSSGVTGSKIRKYSSLLAHWEREGVEKVVAVGGENSNNILGLAQLLQEYQMDYHFFLLGTKATYLSGNRLWLRLLIDFSKITFVERGDWINVELMAQEYVQSQHKKTFFLPEGCKVKTSLPGILSLVCDIVTWEKQNNITFQHLFIDWGTGMTASGLLLGLRYLGEDRNVHITCLTPPPENLIPHYLEKACAEFLGEYVGSAYPKYNLYAPPIAKSFGSVGKRVLEEMRVIAQQTGIIMDPVYSVKHMMSVKRILEENSLQGEALFIYNGGSFAACGFQRSIGKMFL